MILTRRFKNVFWTDSEVCPCLENAMGAGGGNIPMILLNSNMTGIAPHLTHITSRDRAKDVEKKGNS